MKKFSDLTEREVLAVAMASDEAMLARRCRRSTGSSRTVHFFGTAPRHRQLTTQINIDGDKYLHYDFAFGTRDDLTPPVERRRGVTVMSARR
jgi:hypothetical protein